MRRWFIPSGARSYELPGMRRKVASQRDERTAKRFIRHNFPANSESVTNFRPYVAFSAAHPDSREAAHQVRVGSFAPTDALPSTFGQAQRESLDAHRLTYAVCKREHVEKTIACSPC